MIGLCDNCALKYADCKGDKGLEKTKCDYYKKPVVMNVKELAERVAELEVMANRHKWVPVTERLPEEQKLVLITEQTKCYTCDDFYTIELAWLANGEWITPILEYCEEKVTAWMPLPEPYKDGE